MKIVLRKIIVGSVFIVLGVVAGFYYYTHKPLIRIPSDQEHLSAIHFFALGDQGEGGDEQWQVARSMEMLAEKEGTLDFVTFLGDNFYGSGVASISDDKWQTRFEKVYQGEYLGVVPFYAVLGNHDHKSNPAAQIEYSEKHMGSNRWRMPNWHYTKNFGNVDGRPILRIVFIDTCLKNDDLVKEAEFIKEQFSYVHPEPIWKIVIGHYPVRNYGKHGETAEMLSIILPALQQAHVDLYLSGHDHDQQVIAREGEPLYFISGGGGKALYQVKQGASDLLFGRSGFGFTALTVDKDSLKISDHDIQGDLEVGYKMDRRCSLGARKCLQPVL